MRAIGANRYSSKSWFFSTVNQGETPVGGSDTRKPWGARSFPQYERCAVKEESAYYALPAERAVHSGAKSAEAMLASDRRRGGFGAAGTRKGGEPRAHERAGYRCAAPDLLVPMH